MHGITHLLSHHGSHNGDTRTAHHHHHHHDTKSSSASDARHHDTKFFQELLNQKHMQKKVSRGSVSSTYSYGSSTSYGSSHGSNSSNHSSSLHHTLQNHSVYHTIHGSNHHHQSNHHHHHPLYHVHQLHHQSSNGRASPTPPSPTGDHEKPHHHHHHSIQEMIRHFGRRLGHIRRQSECQDPPRKRDEQDFRNRSQSLDGGARIPGLREADCETTYRIYESILRQGALRRSSLDPGARRFSLGTPAIPHRASDACLDPVHAAILFRDARGNYQASQNDNTTLARQNFIHV
ncbi:hypothetical protein WN55_01110 [Dufourea novaeangliae]|uniref:Uncharacterized protein n=1 Tax=Dufourea novaeangliae TaxID=178035 RepID=A0A154PE75_DUFNO|nr:hypothetical protein WN55_01110 [Dufourea novaeangliae]